MRSSLRRRASFLDMPRPRPLAAHRRLPLFQEAKIAFVYFLAHAGGAAYVYEAVVQPLLLEQEPKIDDVVIKANLWLRTNYNSHIAWCVLVLCRWLRQ